MKKILIIHHVSSLGGGTKSLLDMAVMLNKKYDVTICIPAGSTQIVKLAEKYSIKVYQTKTPIPSFNLYSGMPSYFSRYFLSRLFRFIHNKKLVRELMGLKPDAIFYNSIVTALIAKDVPLPVKNICIVRETIKGSLLNFIYKLVFEKKFSGVAYIAEHEKNALSIKVPLQAVIPDSLEPREIKFYPKGKIRSELNIGIDKFCILFMGGITQIKGLDVLLDAIDKLDDNYLAIIAGEINFNLLSDVYILKHIYNINYAKFLFKVKRKLFKLREEGKILFTGYVNDIAPYMNACDVVVFPSTSAHQPRPCIEAGVFKRTVVISDFDATKEYFKNGYNALTFQPGNALELANKIKFLSENIEKREWLAMNNQKMSEELHNYQKIQEELNCFFDKALN